MDTFNQLPNREDYLSAPPSRAPKLRTVKPVNRAQIRWRERLGSSIAVAGIIWAVYVVTHNFAGDWNLQNLMPGPLPVSAIGILIWLHAKWRRASTRE
ncbi:MAG TPA: hypothetical protein VMT53_05210 [Terriglobales bacterium]|nr:hypothetical protein [Terriglobales bacterium]